MATRKSSNALEVNGTRLARMRVLKGLSQEQLAEKIGVAVKTLRNWETRPGQTIHPPHLKQLADYFECPPATLLKDGRAPTVVRTARDLVAENIAIVQAAREFLYVVGTRSRDEDYLCAIEAAIKNNSNLIHYRILPPTPVSRAMAAHIQRLFEIRSPTESYHAGTQSLYVTRFEDARNYPLECCVCMNEATALLVLPSVNTPFSYDTAIIFEDGDMIEGWKRWIGVMARAGQRIVRSEDVAASE